MFCLPSKVKSVSSTMFRYFLRKSSNPGRLSENGRNNNFCNSENEQDCVFANEPKKSFNPNAPLRSNLKMKNKGAIVVKSRDLKRTTPELATCVEAPERNVEQNEEFPDPVSNAHKTALWSLRPAESFLLCSNTTPAQSGAFIKYLAYESACQACFKGMRNGSKEHAILFLKNNCELLRRTLHIESFLTMSRLMEQPLIAQPDVQLQCTETDDVTTPGVEMRILRLSASRIKTPTMENEESSDLLTNSTARQRDIQLKYGDEMIMSPCSKSGRCVGFYKDLRIALKNACLSVLTASYLEDGRVLAQGEVSVKHLLELAERHKTDTENKSQSPSPCKGTNNVNPGKNSLTLLHGVASIDKKSQSPRGCPTQGKWIELTDSFGNALHLCLILEILGAEDQTGSVMTTPEVSIESKRVKGDSAPFCQLSKYQIFQYLFDCFCERQSSRRLELDEVSQWLLRTYSFEFGIQEHYQHLIHLVWIFKTKSATMTEYCLDFILDKYRQLQRENLDYLASTVLKVASDIEALCGKVLENYFRLEEDSETGVSETNWCSEHANYPPSALRPTVALLEILTDTKALDPNQWYKEKLKTAALLKYRRIAENCRVEEEIQIAEDKQETESTEEKFNNRAESITKTSHDELNLERQELYKRVKRICTSLVHDLSRDLRIQESGVLPSVIDLPQITATVYCQELKSQLLSMLEEVPPESPDPVVIDMLLAVNMFDDYLDDKISQRGGSHAPRVYPLEIFSAFVDEWIQGFVASFCEASEAAIVHHHTFEIQGDRIPLLLRNALKFLDDEVAMYERVLKTWSCFGSKIERAICEVLRHVMAIVSQECQMFKKTTTFEYSPLSRHQGIENNSSTCWEWKVIFEFKNGLELISPSQCMLLHSLKRLLIEVPHFEDTLSSWMSSNTNKKDVNLGLEFGLLGQELRSQFSSAVIYSADKITRCLSEGSGMTSTDLLHQLEYNYPQGASAVEVKEISSIYLDYVRTGLMEIRPGLEDRVFVALVRGLWDNVAKELFLFIMELKEDMNNKAWIHRTNSSLLIEIVDTFFKSLLTDVFPHSLVESDTIPPIHAAKSKELVADNTKAFNNSFSVY